MSITRFWKRFRMRKLTDTLFVLRNFFVPFSAAVLPPPHNFRHHIPVLVNISDY
jgi:hypothetical protein